MARICTICERGPRVGYSVSNANNRVKHWVYPNVQTIRFIRADDNKRSVKRANVCTRCIKAKKIEKVV